MERGKQVGVVSGPCGLARYPRWGGVSVDACDPEGEIFTDPQGVGRRVWSSKGGWAGVEGPGLFWGRSRLPRWLAEVGTRGAIPL